MHILSIKMRQVVGAIAALLFIFFSAYSQNKLPKNSVKVKNFEQLKPLLHKQNDTLYVVNFWATWCAPCIQEIPYFEQIGQKYASQKVKVLMVSTDFPNQLQTRLLPFVEKQQMKNEVILLDDPRANRWIPQVDKDWTGAIPATLIYKKDYRKFYPREFTFEELDEVIQSLLNP